MLVLVCYDVAENRRRLRVSNELENFGVRVQRSVFECHIEETELAELQQRLQDLIEPAEDSVRYYSLCGRDAGGGFIDGLGVPSRDWDYRIA